MARFAGVTAVDPIGGPISISKHGDRRAVVGQGVALAPSGGMGFDRGGLSVHSTCNAVSYAY